MGVEGQPVTETNVQLGGKGRGGRKTGRRERQGGIRGGRGKMMGRGALLGKGRKIKAG